MSDGNFGSFKRMDRRQFVGALGAVTLGLTQASSAEGVQASGAPQRPNIVVILADDMGFSDIGCYGGEIQTPNLDRLADEGLRFTQFYNTARCCPTRASLLTGLYPHQAGIGHMVANQGLDGYSGDLNEHCVTIAQVLKGAGYSTYMTGKWHITKSVNPEGSREGWPLQRGFDRYYGIVHGAASYWDPGVLARDNRHISAFDDPEYRPEKYYLTDAITDNMVRFVEEHQQKHADQPLFAYVAYTAAHWPLHAPDDEIARYKGKYDGGYEPIRKARFERLRKMGMLHPEWELSPQAGDWNTLDEKAWEARCMEVYAAQVTRMDRGIGKIVETLRKAGRLENTLLLFLQDNGGCAEDIAREGNTPRQDHPTLPTISKEAVRLEERPRQTRDGYPVLGGKAVLPGPGDTYISYGRNWANVSNTPFREYKHFVHEGGIATPLIAHWPKGIPQKAQGGDGKAKNLEHQPGHLIDIMATCVDVSGAKYPAEWKGKEILPMEGRSLVPAFRGMPIRTREAIFWEHEGNRALRVGKWKLVAKSPRGKWELYDMESDRTELHDLSMLQPERTREMAMEWEKWAKRTHALPWPWRPPFGQVATNDRSSFVLKEGALKQGDSLRGANAPQIEDREITLEVTVEAKGDGYGEGVLVAQGGLTWGFSLYLRDGKAIFALRHNQKLTKIESPVVLSAGRAPLLIRATLQKVGTVTLFLADKMVATGKAPGLLGTQPVDAFCVGFDEHDPVGLYTTPFAYTGKLLQMKLELK